VGEIQIRRDTAFTDAISAAYDRCPLGLI
jgi:hypothetical protein